MHVALIANADWLDENLPVFQYLVAGLLDESVRVTQVVPDALADDDSNAFGQRLAWRDSRWAAMRRLRLARLGGEFQEQGIDLIHALDGRVWGGAVTLARRLGLPLLLGASFAGHAARLPSLRGFEDPSLVAFTATDTPIGDAIRAKSGPDSLVRVIPQGVHVPAQMTRPAPEPGTLCAVVSGCGEYDAEYEALMLALRSVVSSCPQAQFFFAGRDVDQREVWQAARRHGLLAHVSLVPSRLGHHELLLRADVLIHPQACGRSRCLTLQAMAHGVPVVALQDPWLDYLVHDQTAWLLPKPEPDLWVERIMKLIREPTLGSTLADRARQWVRVHHTASSQVQGLISLYRQLVGESIKFAPAGS